ncbi:SCO4225 family membrane protein [Streptomyces sp. NPDC090106]|uniref:SCO4225 family membrane protein n=1 Tax=Streptomyces sp. NPDC090106 TaxID=3365946 RepID=UPI00380A1FCB
MSGIRSSLVPALRTPVALGYLGIVAAVSVWAAVDVLFVEHAGVSLAGVWAFLVTAPTSLLFVMLPAPLAWTGVVIGAVVQAAVLGQGYRQLNGYLARRTGPGTA